MIEATGPVVQGLWIGSRLSILEKLSIRSFLQNGHAYHLYAYGTVEGVPEGTVVMPAGEILPPERIFKYPKYDSYAGFANLFRYHLLYARGGYWADCDVICLRPLDFEVPYVFPTQRHSDGSRPVNNSFLRAPANSEIMRRASGMADAQEVATLEWGDGQRLLTPLVHELGLEKYVAPPNRFCPIDWWRWADSLRGSFWARLRIRLRLTAATYSVHLWNELWRRDHVDKNGAYDHRSLYEKLKQRYGTSPEPVFGSSTKSG